MLTVSIGAYVNFLQRNRPLVCRFQTGVTSSSTQPLRIDELEARQPDRAGVCIRDPSFRAR